MISHNLSIEYLQLLLHMNALNIFENIFIFQMYYGI